MIKSVKVVCLSSCLMLILSGCNFDLALGVNELRGFSFKDQVNFNDANLQSCFDEYVAENQLQYIDQVVSLECRGQGIINIDGLTQLTALSTADFRNNPLDQQEVNNLIAWSDNNNVTLLRSPITFQELSSEIIDVNFQGCIDDAIMESNGSWVDVSDIDTLSCHYLKIESLSGLDALYNLTEFSFSDWLRDGSLAPVDFQFNTKLERLFFDNNTQIEIDLTPLSDLIELEVRGVNIKGDDLSKNTKLSTLTLRNNQMLRIDLSPLILLESLTIHDQLIDTISIQMLTELRLLEINNTFIDEIDLSYNILLEDIDFDNNYLSVLDLSGLIYLTDIYIDNNRFRTLVIEDLPLLEDFDAEGNLLTSISFSNLPNLEEIDVSDNYLDSISFNGVDNLDELYLENNFFTEIDVSNLVNLTDLDLEKNRLTSIIFPENAKIDSLDIQQNQLNNSSIDLSRLPDLSYFYLYNNQFSGIFDLSQNSELINFVARHNAIESVVLPSSDKIQRIDLSYNNLSFIDLSGFTQIDSLDLAYNQISNIIFPNTQFLNSVTINNNALSTLDLSQTPSLSYLMAQNNNIGNIIGLSSTQLSYIDLSNNQLTEFDMSVLPTVYSFDIDLRENQLHSLTLSPLTTNLNSLLLWGNPLENILFSGETLFYEDSLFLIDLSLLTSASYNALSNLTNKTLVNRNIFNFNVTDEAFKSCIDQILKDQLIYHNVLLVSELQSIDCNNSAIAVVDNGSQFSSLIDLAIDSKNLLSFDITSFNQLRELNLEEGQITTLDLSHFTQLMHLEISDMPITELSLPSVLQSNLTDIELTDTRINTFDSAYFLIPDIDIDIDHHNFDAPMIDLIINAKKLKINVIDVY